MSKIVALIVIAIAAVGGGAYGLYAYTDVFESSLDLGCCEVTHTGGCCGQRLACDSSENTDMTALVAIAGPVGVVQPNEPTSQRLPCCSAKTNGTVCPADEK